MKKAIMRTEHLAVGYLGKVVVDDINVEVERGKILTLIGPNGAGKSTILKSITRQLEIVSGTVYIDDEEMKKMQDRALAKKVSAMMTGQIRPELMNCRDVVESGRYPYTGQLGILSQEDHEKVDEAMELVAVTELADRDFGAISDGQRQRVMLARAIAQDPEVLILDEPTSFLDVHHKLELLAILKELVLSKDLAVIMSLHELDLAQKVSDKVLCVGHNRVDRYGRPEEIFDSEYIADLYEMNRGTYNALFGSMEMARPVNAGEPQIFVIGGGGSGVAVYRSLNRLGVPFAAGVLAENDLEYPVAEALAEKVIVSKPFEPIGADEEAEARSMIENVSAVIAAVTRFGADNRANERLIGLAREAGKLTTLQEWEEKHGI